MSEAGPERSRKFQNRLISKFTNFLGEFSAGTILLCILSVLTSRAVQASSGSALSRIWRNGS